MYNKSVINIPLLQSRWVGCFADDLGFRLLHEQLSHNRAKGGPHSCSLDLCIILTLEEEICLFEAELQIGGDMMNGHGSSSVDLCVLSYLVFNDGNGLVH